MHASQPQYKRFMHGTRTHEILLQCSPVDLRYAGMRKVENPYTRRQFLNIVNLEAQTERDLVWDSCHLTGVNSLNMIT